MWCYSYWLLCYSHCMDKAKFLMTSGDTLIGQDTRNIKLTQTPITHKLDCTIWKTGMNAIHFDWGQRITQHHATWFIGKCWTSLPFHIYHLILRDFFKNILSASLSASSVSPRLTFWWDCLTFLLRKSRRGRYFKFEATSHSKKLYTVHRI